MRNFGKLLLIGGALALIIVLNMKTSVSTGFGEVNNLGLIADKQNFLLMSLAAIVAGLVLLAVGKNGSRDSDDPFDQVNSANKDEKRHALNERKRYAISLGITRTHGAYSFGRERFITVDDAIKHAEANPLKR